MPFWLVKSEPSAWSWSQQVACGAKGTQWSGVRNHGAKLHLQAMRLGEKCFFYHSNDGKEIVGLVEVCRTFYPDPSDEGNRFGMVDVCAVKALPKPVSLAKIKATPELAKMALVTNSRLSVQPVTLAEWQLICEMAELPSSS